MLAGGRDTHQKQTFLHREALPAEKLEEPLPGIQAAILHHGHKFICSREQQLQAFQGRTITLNLQWKTLYAAGIKSPWQIIKLFQRTGSKVEQS